MSDQDIRFYCRSADINADSIYVRTTHEVKVSGALTVMRDVVTPGIITDQITSGRAPLKLFEIDVPSINPNGDKLRIGGPVTFQNGLSISNTECGNCGSTTTLSSADEANRVCLKCINDIVIYHQAHQNWLETNGDPIISLKKEIAMLRQEIADLKGRLLK